MLGNIGLSSPIAPANASRLGRGQFNYYDSPLFESYIQI
jgi:hypothetical protein